VATTQAVQRRWLKQADLFLVLLMAAAIGVGITSLASIAANGSAGYLKRQLVWVALGMVGFLAGAVVECERLSRFARGIYTLNVSLLVAVLIIGHEAKGSVRWFGTETVRFQPSELAKLLVILTLAALFSRRIEDIQKLRVFLLSVVHVLVPIILIMKQPDLGTSLAIVAVWVGMAFVADMPVKRIAVFLLGGALVLLLAWKIGVIHDYQKARLMAVLQPDADPGGATYQVRQARIAIGAGQVTGRGFSQGSQAHRKFIPERQTDFIFTVPAEEGGFVASVFIVAVYTALLLRGWLVVVSTTDLYSRLVAAGILSMLGFHIYVNLGMTMGLLPVTGVPLPFISYGGSATVVAMTSVGLLVGISGRREALVF